MIFAPLIRQWAAKPFSRQALLPVDHVLGSYPSTRGASPGSENASCGESWKNSCKNYYVSRGLVSQPREFRVSEGTECCKVITLHRPVFLRLLFRFRDVSERLRQCRSVVVREL